MSDPKTWPRLVRAQAKPGPKRLVKSYAESALLLVAFMGFCAAVVLWRNTGGRL